MRRFAISRETGTLLYMLARSSHARTIVEFGTSFGISTLHLAAALKDNGGGHLITSEFEPSKVTRARDNLMAGGLIDLVEIWGKADRRPADVGSSIPETIDLLLLDGAPHHPEIMSMVESHEAGAVIVAGQYRGAPLPGGACAGRPRGCLRRSLDEMRIRGIGWSDPPVDYDFVSIASTRTDRVLASS